MGVRRIDLIDLSYIHMQAWPFFFVPSFEVS